MSYLMKIEYEIVPVGSYKVMHNCSGCGRKTTFINTGKFRINANGGKLDVWLIYQCEKCKHTYNLTIFERVKPESLPKEEYKSFLANDEELALKYGTNKAMFTRNKAEVDLQNIEYSIKKKSAVTSQILSTPRKLEIVVYNPYGMKIRTDKMLADILDLSRNRAKEIMDGEGTMVEMIGAMVKLSNIIENDLEKHVYLEELEKEY